MERVFPGFAGNEGTVAQCVMGAPLSASAQTECAERPVTMSRVTVMRCSATDGCAL
jgi:hypothetical protein